MSESSVVVTAAPQSTPPPPSMDPPSQTPDTSRSLEINIDGANDKATGNEILDRFLLNIDAAQRPITGSRSAPAMNSLDNVHDLRLAVPKTLYTQIGKSVMPPLLQDLYGKVQVARSSHIFPRGSQVTQHHQFVSYCLK